MNKAKLPMNSHYRNASTLTVTTALVSDIPGILAVLDQNLLAKKDAAANTPASLEQTGFLITRHTAAHLQEWIEDTKNHLILVCKEGAMVVGYLLSCDWTVMPEGLRTQFQELASLKTLLTSTPVLYHKQIATQPGLKGVGKALMRYFFEAAGKKGYHHIACMIVHEPVLNKVSVAFHQKHGFECVGRVQVEHMRDGVYLKK